MAAVEIVHTRRDGTLVKGTQRGDQSAGVLKLRSYGPSGSLTFRFSRTLDCWYLPHSLDRQAHRPSLELLAERLRAAGFDVTTRIDEDERRAFAQAEQERADRAEDRAERFAGYADSAAGKSEDLRSRARAMADRIPPGQPILIGHHSELADRNYRERIHTLEGKGIEEGERAAHWSGRQKAAETFEQHRRNPGVTLRRIAKLEASERSWLRSLDGHSSSGWDHRDPQHAEEMKRRLAEVREELGYWRQVIAEAERNGFKVWSPSDFVKGDFVSWRGRWYEVLRVNARTLTIPSILNIHEPVITLANNTFDGMTNKLPYDDVRGRRSTQDMRDTQEPGKEQTP